MFNSPVLDLVILLSFTYFIGSLLLSAINEAIAGTLRLRQQDLKNAIVNFFFSASWKSFARHAFLQSPAIQSLMKRKGRMPAYIPAKNFVQGIIEHLDDEAYRKGEIVPLDKDKKPAIKKDENYTNAVLPQEMLDLLSTIMKQVGALDLKDRVIEFEKRLEEFYNLTMDRVTGWYKRRIRRISLVLGLALAIALNIDTIKIVNDAMADKGKLSKAVDNIAANLDKFKGLENKPIVVNDSAGKIQYGESFKNGQETILTYQKTTGYQLGYDDFDNFKNQWNKDFWKKILGVLLTAFALQLGSNYWFDLLNKAVNVRAAGRKPDQERPATKPSNN